LTGCTVTPTNQIPIKGRIRKAIGQTNIALANSRVNVILRPVHIGYLPTSVIKESDGTQKQLLNTLATDLYVQTLRNCVNADLVSLIVDKTDFIFEKNIKKFFDIRQGISRLLVTENDPSAAFSVVSREQATDEYVFAHEIGHNLVSAQGMGNFGVLSLARR
jgi:hypothetical protein